MDNLPVNLFPSFNMHFSTLTALAAFSATAAFALPAAENNADIHAPYAGPGNYILQNAATGTVLDLLNGVNSVTYLLYCTI